MTSDINYYVWLAAASIAATSLLARTFVKERARIGALAYFSPSFGFYVVYLLSFIARPVAIHSGALVDYSENAGDPAQFQAILLLSLLGAIAFYLAYDPPFRLKLTSQIPQFRRNPLPSVSRLRGMVSALLWTSVFCSAVFFILIYQLGAATTDLGVNRAVFSAGVAGQGHLFLINTTAAVALLVALYLRSYYRSPLGLVPILSIVWFLLPNIIVTNRFLITAMLAAVFICWLLHLQSKGLRMPTRGVLLFLAAVALAGSALGMSRGLGEYEFDETNSSSPLIFFLWTFDMSELLARTVKYKGDLDFGMIWLQDLLYLYVPRALWAEKPQIYGAIHAQSIVLPEMIPSNGIPIATYPIGMFGEGYFTFGVFGVVIALTIVGAILRRLFASLQVLRQRQPYIGAWLFPVFVLQCLNPLGYFRSVGWFMSLVVFHLLVCGIVIGFVLLMQRSERRRWERPLSDSNKISPYRKGLSS